MPSAAFGSPAAPTPEKAMGFDPQLLVKLATQTMPFGKYQGWLLADVPGPYLSWMARQGFPKGELGRALALLHTLDHNALRHLLDPLRVPG